MDDYFYDKSRMDWRSMFWYCPVRKLVRLMGYKPEHRSEYGKIMWTRKSNYRKWLQEHS